LRELKAWKLILLDAHGYKLTPSGQELLRLLMPLNAWCMRHVSAQEKRGRPKRSDF